MEQLKILEKRRRRESGRHAAKGLQVGIVPFVRGITTLTRTLLADLNKNTVVHLSSVGRFVEGSRLTETVHNVLNVTASHQAL